MAGLTRLCRLERISPPESSPRVGRIPCEEIGLFLWPAENRKVRRSSPETRLTCYNLTVRDVYRGSVPPASMKAHGKRIMVMWFYDDSEEVEEFQLFRRESRQLEREYLELGVALRDTETALLARPEDEELNARARHLSGRVKDLKRQFPWLSAEAPVELALWGTPHG